MKASYAGLDFDTPLVMGVLNVTPDSFSDGGTYPDAGAAVAHALRMEAEGADIIDIGGESSRPGSDPVSLEEELARVIPVLDALQGKLRIPISIDTYKPEVAEEALAHGAAIINDITGLGNPRMLEAAAGTKAPVILMHMQGVPKSMHEHPHYADVVAEVKAFFSERVAAARTAGVTDIILDPGLGFGKTAEHNLEILQRLSEFQEFKLPILVGPSRKSFIGKITGEEIPGRLAGTLGAVAVAVYNGAAIVRVHDVKPARDAALVAYAIRHTKLD